jgi:predicted DNA-binding transcriptional regulator AlpA
MTTARPALTPIAVADVPRLALRRAEMAEALGVSDRWLWSKTQAGLIPHVTIGGVVMYPVDAIRQWLIDRTENEKSRAASGDDSAAGNAPLANGDDGHV